MSSDSVLDVGCGTGALLHAARESGHTGRLCGLDPARGMLRQARKRSDIDWVLGDLTSAIWESEFDLVVMTGHAFQVLIDDEDLRISLTAIRSVLTPNGRFIFETRNPLARGWEAWVPENAVEIVDATGAVVRMAHRVEKIDKDLVTFIATFSSSSWDEPKRSRSTLKFLSALSLSLFLTDAGLAVAKQFGDWDRQPLTESSPEIITIAHREE
jgi:SAM-dependent methyltransferase